MTNLREAYDRIAVLADVHGNLPAVTAVLADVETAQVDLIVLNGDVAAGPMPAETLDRLLGIGPRARWVRGNADRAMVEHFDAGETAPGGDDLDRWAATQITAAHRNVLAAMPLTLDVQVRGLGPVTLCHATPRRDDELLFVDDSVEQFRNAFARLEAPTIVLGHTHMPFDRLVDRHRVVNAGSVGMPYGHTGASWLLLGPDVVLRRTPYDVDTACCQLARSSMPGLDAFLAGNVRSSPSDVDASETLRTVRRRLSG